ncbi:MAG: hypothetical protein NTZ49_01150 [Candidatus Parcubacteria bacterium]|nr:hypothetical protein [Candidatus Parcubacteria bacterium]
MTKKNSSGREPQCPTQRLKDLQALTSELAAYQEKAVLIPCPCCKKELKRKDIYSVFCPKCKLLFNCRALVESCDLEISG